MDKNNKARIFKDSPKYSNVFLLIAIGVIFASGVLLLLLYSNVVSGNFNNGGSVNFNAGGENLETLILLPAIGLVSLAAIFVFLVFRTVQKRSFELSDDKIVSKYNNVPETSINFENIAQVYRLETVVNQTIHPMYGLLNVVAYRQSQDDFWVVARPVLRENGKKNSGGALVRGIVENFVKHNLPKTLSKIQQGETVCFDYLQQNSEALAPLSKINQTNRLLFSLANLPLQPNRYCEKAKTFNGCTLAKIYLSKDGIEQNRKTYFEKGDELVLQPVGISRVLGRNPLAFETGKTLKIINNGQEKISIDLTKMVNSDLFLETLKSLI